MVGDLVNTYEPAEGLAHSQAGRVRLQISVPNGDVITAKNGLTGVSQVLVDDEDADAYLLKLRNGDTIKPSEMSLKKRVRLERFANSVSAEQAEDEIVIYLQELGTAGYLG